MALPSDFEKLEQLRQRGVLSEEEFVRAKARLLEGSGPGPSEPPGAASQAFNRFRRSCTDRWLGGICGGLARVTGLDSWAWRLILVLLVLFGGTGLLLYLLLRLFVPAE